MALSSTALESSNEIKIQGNVKSSETSSYSLRISTCVPNLSTASSAEKISIKHRPVRHALHQPRRVQVTTIPQIAVKAEYSHRFLKSQYNDEPSVSIGIAYQGFFM